MSSRRIRWSEQPTTAEFQALIDAHIEAFNTQNTELFLSVFGNTAVVIDGIAQSHRAESVQPQRATTRPGAPG